MTIADFKTRNPSVSAGGLVLAEQLINQGIEDETVLLSIAASADDGREAAC